MKNWYKRASDLFFCSMFLVCLTAPAFGQSNMFRKVNDFDGDGKADFAVTRDEGGKRIWHILQSNNGYKAVQFGIDIDVNASGDYDGDGKTDIAIFRNELTPTNNRTYSFWILGSQMGVRASVRTTNNYSHVVPMHQDYDGDGKTDVSYTGRDHTTHYVEWSRAGGSISLASPGGDLIRLGDMNGNNVADGVGQTYNSTLGAYVNRYRRVAGGNVEDVIFGIFGDQFVAADFDGDGTGDLAVFRPSNGTWWWIRSSDRAMHAAQFGQNGDVPVPADYDGDGKTDLAIWRPGETQSVYWVYGSTGNIMVVPFGIGTDKVVTY